MLTGSTTMSVIHIRMGNLAKIHPLGNWWTKEGFDVRAAIVCYHLSKLLLYKHELLLSKCPLTVDWLLIRPVWNEISNEPLNYDPIPERTISDTHIPLLSPSSVYVSFSASVLTWSHLFFFFFMFPVCNCSRRSDQCEFDAEQYRSTGSGGRCLSCKDNTDGPHCERCRENHYRSSSEEPCLPCNCNINGTFHSQTSLLSWHYL